MTTLQPFNRFVLLTGVVVSATAVALGAFGAHGLEQVLPEWYQDEELVAKRLANWETAVRYQMYHGLALLIVGAVGLTRPHRMLTIAAISLLLGATIFSGSLYVLVLTGQTIWGAVTPLGGVLQLLGWVFAGIGFWLACGSLKKEK